MRRQLSSIFTILLVIGFAGCGGGNNSPSPPPPVVNIASGKFLYVANSADATVSGFAIAPSGVLTPVPGGNVATYLFVPTGLAVGSAAKVYAGSSVSRDVTTFSADLKTGQLSNPLSLPNNFLVGLNHFAGTNATHLVSCGTHLFALGETFGPADGGGTYSVGWGGFAFSLNSDGSIDPYEWSGFGLFDSPPIVSNGFIDPSCRYIFHANTAEDLAVQTTVDTAAHSGMAYQGYAAGSAPVWVAADPNLKFLYVANSGSNDVSVFSIDVASGRLTPIAGSPFAAGKQPSSVIVVSSWVYVANAGDNTVSAFTWNPTTGALTPVAASPFPVGNTPGEFVSVTTDLSHSSSGMLLYVANQGSNNVSAFVVDSNGQLRAVAGSPFAVGGQPKGMAVLVAPQ